MREATKRHPSLGVRQGFAHRDSARRGGAWQYLFMDDDLERATPTLTPDVVFLWSGVPDHHIRVHERH